MFTGIIEAVGRVEDVQARERGRRLTIAAPFAVELRPDDSVAVDGVCLTVVGHDQTVFRADVIAETLAKTNLGRLQPGDGVNLERPMVLGERLHGHIVQGHVDATAEVVDVQAADEERLLTLRYPRQHSPYLIPLGSVALDGISFTVARLTDQTLAVAVIPHTWQRTTVSGWHPGRRVNLEYDLIGKYVVRALQLGLIEGLEPARRFLSG